VPELIDPNKLKQIVEAALMAADEPLTLERLARLFAHGELDSEEGRAQLRDTLSQLEAETGGRGYELVRVASGYRYQVRQELSEWVSRLWEEKPPRYTRALLETLALIAYKQPVTRGDIEQVRGVAVSQNIMRTLLERGWIRVVGQREVPGKPSLYGTTRAFLDYFALKSLDQLPPLAEIKSLIEPLVLDEVVQEAREVAERDHPELAAMGETWQGADSGSGEPAEEASARSHDERQNDTRFRLEDGGDDEASADGSSANRSSANRSSDDEPFDDEPSGAPFGDDAFGEDYGRFEAGLAAALGDGEDEDPDEAGRAGSTADAEDGEREADIVRVSVDEIDAQAPAEPDREAPSATIVQLPVPPRR
jgi:segregation and condensation protein B